MKSMKEFNDKINYTINKDDIFKIEDELYNRLIISPNSTTYEVAHSKFNVAFCIQLDELDFEESVSIGVSLEQAVDLVNFLNSKILKLKNI